MTRSFTTVLLVALAACGGGKSAPKTPSGEPSAAAGPAEQKPAEPQPPAEPPPPSEPAQPAAPAEPDPRAQLLAAETAAWETAKPVLEKYCAVCHTPDGKKAAKKKLAHFDMSVYPPRGHHTATMGVTMRDVLGLSGKKPTMPFDKPGLVKGDELATVKAWTDAWEAAEKGGAHPPPK